MAESHRNFDGDLRLVFSKLSIADANVLNVYLIGSRMWGTASNSSDHDLYIVIKGNESARNSHFKIPGFEIDAVVVGMAYFQSRLDSGKLKELSCLWAPESCKLLERHAFRVAGNQVDRAALLKSLHEGHEKDWRRARKLVESGRVSEGKKVLLHDLRAHLLAVQIVREGKIVDYEAGHEVHDWINYTFSKSWDVFAAEFEPKIASLLDFLRNVNAGESASAPMELQSLTISKEGRSDYWFGDDLSPSRITRRQISADADEAAVSTLEDRLRLAADETRNDDSKLDKLKRIMAEALEQGLTEESSAVKYAQGAIDECAAYRKRAADSRKEEVQIPNYPSTPHLPFSPTVHSDDIQMPAVSPSLLKEEVVVTEKLDGGNCCLHNGEVYARTHSAPTTNNWFSRTKMKLSSFAWVPCLKPLKIFGENMEAIHSISYGVPVSSLFLFGVYDSTHGGFWWPWDSVVALAALLHVPHAHVVFRGELTQPKDIKNIMDSEMKNPTSVQRMAPEFADLSEDQHVFPEGFVIRVCRGFAVNEFETAMGKYVREGHLQTKDDFRRNWTPSIDRPYKDEEEGERSGDQDLQAACQRLIRDTRKQYFARKEHITRHKKVLGGGGHKEAR